MGRNLLEGLKTPDFRPMSHVIGNSVVCRYFPDSQKRAFILLIPRRIAEFFTTTIVTMIRVLGDILLPTPSVSTVALIHSNNPLKYIDPLGLIWETVDIDYHGTKNWAMALANRLANLEEGTVFYQRNAWGVPGTLSKNGFRILMILKIRGAIVLPMILRQVTGVRSNRNLESFQILGI
jgi:hypothetical protein